MVPPSKKRKLPAAVPGPASKRPKNPQPKPTPAKKNKNKGNAPAKKDRRPIEAASLAWQSVGEEFGALEVIEGVDVVRDGDTVQFVVTEDQKQQDTATDSATDGNKEQGEQKNEDESFEGFGDDPVEGGPLDPSQAGHREDSVAGSGPQAKTQGKEAGGSKKKDKKEVGDVGAKGNDKLAAAEKKLRQSAPHGNAFGALAELADGQEDGADDEVDVDAWLPLKLSPRLLEALARLKFANPTAIQQQAIPEILAGGDVIGKAQTGSGKTLAFAIPIVEKWLEIYAPQDDESENEEKEKPIREGPMAVVLSPTRELAKQLGDHIKALCDGLEKAPYVCVVTGGLSILKQQRQLEKADIVIGTPGRLWEVLGGDMALQDTFTKIKFLVVDEADRLFKAGQFKEAEDIIGALDRKDPEADDDDSDDDADLEPRQTLVFSATFDKDLQTKLAGKGKSKRSSDDQKMEYLMKCLRFRQEPKFIDVNPVTSMADRLKEGLVECGAMEKDLYLYAVLALNPGKRTLVFTNSISAVRRVTPLLQNLNLTVMPLHSQMAQKARLRSIERFTASKSSILVATDVAARGLDIHDVEQVLHYHVPRAADTYIHRAGRTARGEKSGVSIILCSPEEVVPTQRLAAKVHAKRARSNKRQRVIQTLPLDRKIAARLKPRVDLSKRLADAALAKEKGHSEDVWLRDAADELGVVYDSDEFEESGSAMARGGRGGGRKRKEKEARALTKAEMGALRAQLREELGRRVNLGVSERYITGGRVDVAALLRQREKASEGGIFLGGDGLGFDL